jgi:hypothetical protein
MQKWHKVEQIGMAPYWVTRPEPKFMDLEKVTAELIASCQRGMDAARAITAPVKVKKSRKVKKVKKVND